MKKYELTLKGVLATNVTDPQRVINDIELYMRRAGYNGILLKAPGVFHFVRIEKEDK